LLFVYNREVMRSSLFLKSIRMMSYFSKGMRDDDELFFKRDKGLYQAITISYNFTQFHPIHYWVQ
jgi:hypothetical protein